MVIKVEKEESAGKGKKVKVLSVKKETVRIYEATTHNVKGGAQCPIL